MTDTIKVSRTFVVVEFVDQNGSPSSYDDCSIVMLVSDDGVTEPRAKSALFPVVIGDKLREDTEIQRIE